MREQIKPGQRGRFRSVVRVAAMLGPLLTLCGPGLAEQSINATADNVAINGYDTVAYFVDGKATKGASDHEAVWQDVRWYFASDEHRKLFEADPSRYAPQFGGWCAAGVAAGHLYSVDAETWTIVDGKLYLYYNREIADKWRQDRGENIARAEKAWSEQAEAN